jgi:SAM-dependent methyltransferase
VCGGPTADWVLGPGQVLDRCAECGHLRRDLHHCPAGARAAAWGGEARLDGVRLELTYRRIRRALPAPPHRVFDVGHGTAALLRRFLDGGADVVDGTDPGSLGLTPDPVVAARGGLRHVPVEEVAPPAGGYDLVTAVHVVEHAPDPVRFVRACARLLAPGGSLVLLTPAGDSDGLRLFGPHWWMLEDPTHVRFFTADSLSRLVSAAGLRTQVQRLVADSLAVEAASAWRRAGRRPPEGVLPAAVTRATAVASLPLVLPARVLRPRLRPTLQAVARRDGPG